MQGRLARWNRAAKSRDSHRIVRSVVIVAAKLFCRNHGPEQVTLCWGSWQLLLKRLKRRNPFRPVRAPSRVWQRGALRVAFALPVPPKHRRRRAHRTRFTSPPAGEERSFMTARGMALLAPIPSPTVRMEFCGPAIRALILIIVGFFGDPHSTPASRASPQNRAPLSQATGGSCVVGHSETFTFLGFTHFCGQLTTAAFIVWRITAKKRRVAKLKALRAELSTPEASSYDRGRCIAPESCAGPLPIPRCSGQLDSVAHFPPTRLPAVAECPHPSQSTCPGALGSSLSSLDPVDSSTPHSASLSRCPLRRYPSPVRAVWCSEAS